ncbi:ATP-binding protein [Terasakiella pusilla]|uniref:ATP-binding protein n=1 Tax=Terasakiella pusilla TaxID=64973 RepID=UPI003AA7E22A
MLRLLSPFPFVNQEKELENGLLKSIPQTCSNCNSRECSPSGYSLSELEVQSCLNGYNFTKITDFNHEDTVIIGFLLKGNKYPKNYKTLMKDGIELTSDSLQKLKKDVSLGGKVSEKIQEVQNLGKNKALHDIKHLINALMRQIDSKKIIDISNRNPKYYSNEDITKLKDCIISSSHILSAIENQINMADYIVAPDFTKFSDKANTDIFKLMHKSSQIYNSIALPAGKEIIVTRSGAFINAEREIKEHFALLPAILLQNAIKYSTSDKITVIFECNQNLIEFRVESKGPIVPEAERDKIWKLGGQFIHQNDTNKGGNGFGLYLASKICDDCGFTINYISDKLTEKDGIPIGSNTFVVKEKADADFFKRQNSERLSNKNKHLFRR